MGAADALQVIDTLVRFSSATRLYELMIGDDGATDLLVEAFTADDALQEIGGRHVIALSTDAYPANEAAAIEQLSKWNAKCSKLIDEDAALAKWAARAFNNPDTKGPAPRNPALDGLTNEQRAAAEEFSRTKKIPAMITSGREPFVGNSSTNHLTARAGYLRYRKIYAGKDSVLISKADEVGEDGQRVA